MVGLIEMSSMYCSVRGAMKYRLPLIRIDSLSIWGMVAISAQSEDV